jgi:AcrR family transcriptional regulator
MAVDAKTPVVGREDPRVTRTQKMLQDAFISLLGEKGFHAITVQDIAERATVNRATFYAHFLDKYDLFDQMTGEFFQQALASRVSADSPLTNANLKTLIVTVFETLAQTNDHCKPAARELSPLIEAKAQGEIRAFLLAWFGRPSGLQSVGPGTREVAATVLSWAIFGAGIEWSRGARARPAEDVAVDVLSLLTGGLSEALESRLATPPGAGQGEANGPTGFAGMRPATTPSGRAGWSTPLAHHTPVGTAPNNLGSPQPAQLTVRLPGREFVMANPDSRERGGLGSNKSRRQRRTNSKLAPSSVNGYYISGMLPGAPFSV